MGADTNTALNDPEVHSSRAGAGIPLMLQHYWWGEKALIDAGLPVTALRCNFFMNHLLKVRRRMFQAVRGLTSLLPCRRMPSRSGKMAGSATR